jgi:uncharacterized protein
MLWADNPLANLLRTAMMGAAANSSEPEGGIVPMVESAGEGHGKREKWLVAAWPGMGNVGVGACAYLVAKLHSTMVHEMPPGEHYEIQHIDVKDGLAKPGRVPRSMFFEWSKPDNSHDLLIYLAEAQPDRNGYKMCTQVLDYAASKGVDRVITFAAMATQLHPADVPNVFGIATNGEGIRQLQSLEVALLKEGEITGLNGVMLAAALERGLPGMCLMGELPYFAAGVPNPKSSTAVLEVFSAMSDIRIDLSDLKQQADAVEQGLIELLKKLQEAAGQQGTDEDDEGFSIPEVAREADEVEGGDDEAGESSTGAQLDDEARARIESLFSAAEEDRSKAVHLKQELDRLGVFKEYEDRFLDLFKRAE